MIARACMVRSSFKATDDTAHRMHGVGLVFVVWIIGRSHAPCSHVSPVISGGMADGRHVLEVWLPQCHV